jgi:hypothetical protein
MLRVCRFKPIMERVAESSSGTTPTTLTFYSGHRAVAAAAGASTIYVDSYSGEKLGMGSAGVRNFFRSAANWHRYLAMSGDSRPTGKSITGVANLLFLLTL